MLELEDVLETVVRRLAQLSGKTEEEEADDVYRLYCIKQNAKNSMAKLKCFTLGCNVVPNWGAFCCDRCGKYYPTDES